MSDISDRARDLTAFANASGQPNQPMPERSGGASGHGLVRATTGLADRVLGAQPVAVYRDETRILQKLATLAAAAGSDWFYRYPVRLKDGGQDWIEGPSIKLANDVARIFGNNVNEVRELDVGDAWVFYARFTDIETGFSMERAYRQRKAQTSIKTKDADRQQDIAYQIGQSKAIRNCIVNSLQVYADYAFEHARNSLVERIGKELDRWRERTLQGIAKIPVDLKRVERVVGRSAADWLAPNIAQIVSMMKAIADGMATVDEIFPPIVESKPPAQEQQQTSPAEKPDSERREGSSEQAGAAAAPPAAAVAGDTVTEDGAIAQAYAKGRDAKAAGHQRRAMPGELRAPERAAEAKAWERGFDETPAPTKNAKTLV